MTCFERKCKHVRAPISHPTISEGELGPGVGFIRKTRVWSLFLATEDIVLRGRQPKGRNPKTRNRVQHLPKNTATVT